MRTKTLLVAAMGAATLSAMPSAQAQITLNRGAAINQSLPLSQAATQLRRNARVMTPKEKQDSGIIVMTLLPAPNPFAAAAAAMAALDAAAMKGWTPLTNGATLGGPAVFRSGNVTRIMVRAGDGYFYLADIDPANPGGPIDGGAWKKVNIKASSDAHCEAGMTGFSPTGGVLCGYLDGNGQAMVAWIDGNSYSSPVATGGSKAGARPTIGAGPSQYSCACDPSGASAPFSARIDGYVEYVWDGGSGLWRRYTLTHTQYGYGTGATMKSTDVLGPENQGWKKVNANVTSPIGCVQTAPGSSTERCAQNYAGGVGYIKDDDLMKPGPIGFAMSPPLPGGPSFKAAPVMLRTASGAMLTITRNANGRLYRRAEGGWTEEGGAAKDGSQIACIANNEQPTCFIQGPDGRIYWKKFGTASGL